MQYQGQLLARFDANSYLYITRPWIIMMLPTGVMEIWKKPVVEQRQKFLLSLFMDWLYTPEQMKELSFALYRNRKNVTYVDIPSTYGHDAFLLEVDKLTPIISKFLKGGIAHGI